MKRRIHLNGKRMITKEVTHSYLKRKFSLPDYYGRNLDALWDLLSTHLKDTEIQLVHEEALRKNLGSYGQKLLVLFEDLEGLDHGVKGPHRPK